MSFILDMIALVRDSLIVGEKLIIGILLRVVLLQIFCSQLFAYRQKLKYGSPFWY